MATSSQFEGSISQQTTSVVNSHLGCASLYVPGDADNWIGRGRGFAVIELSRHVFEPLRKDEEFILYRGRSKDAASQAAFASRLRKATAGLGRDPAPAGDSRVLVLSPLAEYPAPETLKRLEDEYSFREELDATWAVRPIAMARHCDRPVLVSEDPGGVPLDQLLGQPLGRSHTLALRPVRRSFSERGSLGEGGLAPPRDLAFWLRLAVGLSSAVDQLHRRGIIHKDIKPANVLVNCVTGKCWLMGFGIASRLPRERQTPKPPEFIAGTLAYMAPEQTGRMNRSIDSRSDLYALGVTLYEMLTGSLPFMATDPMEWVHCHIAKQPVPPSERLKELPATVSAIILKLLAKTAEERYQTAAGVRSDLQRCLAEWERGSDFATPFTKAASEFAARSDKSASASPARLSSPKSYHIDEFPLGENDTPDRLLIPENLYGRAREIDTLLASFDRVLATGRPELVLVSGYSGIGKSSVVNELHKVLVPSRGLFASGKFDQYKRDIPYVTLAQALQSLVRSLLGKSEAELRTWCIALHEALGPNGPLMVDLVPELKLIIGEQPSVPELPPQDAKRRFQLVFRRFIGVFAQPEHPLALFLDDLQWLDAATLDLLEDLLGQPDVQHLMLIGAYRDNEVDSAHPLKRKLEAIRQAGAIVHEIILAPLTREDLGRLIADSLHCDLERVTPLARLIHDKTAGNPFFAIQFISALAEEALLTFDHGGRTWCWDLSRIQAKGYTDNVVNLMIGKLNRLPAKTQRALQEFACLGNTAEITTLSIVHGLVLRNRDGEGGLVLRSPAQPDEGGSSEENVHADLWAAVRLEFIVRLEGSYRFIHDRVQEAAYSLVPEQLRAEVHLRIGRLLVAHSSPERREEAIFEIVNQLNRGAALITSQEEREQLAELNLIAGKRAKASTAYASALKYLITGAALLAGSPGPDLEPVAPNGSPTLNRDSPFDALDACSWQASHLSLLTSYVWERRHELAFDLELNRAECDFLTGELVAAEKRLTELSSRAADSVEQATVACLRMDLYTTLDQSHRAVAVCLDYLRYLGVEWSPHPSEEEARREYEQIWIKLGSRAIEELIDLPLMSNPAPRATLDVLAKVFPPASFTDANLRSLAICRAVNLSLEHGNSDGSSVAYVWLGMIAGPQFGNYKAGFRFGQLGYELVEKRGLKRFQARTYLWFGRFVLPLTKHVWAGVDLLRLAFDTANNVGDVTVAAYSCYDLNTSLLAAGGQLPELQREAEHGLEFAQKARFGLIIDCITAQLGLIRTLRGLTPKFGSFDDGQFDELWFELHLASEPVLAQPECWYWIRKLQARFLAGDYASAVDASLRAQRLLWTSPSLFETAEYHFYGALARAAVADSATYPFAEDFGELSRAATADESEDKPSPRRDLSSDSSAKASAKAEHLKALAEHHKQLALWAENCPENFENRVALIGAEIARVEGRELDAERLYEEAIRSARANGFIHNEALAYEVAARFYAGHGFEDFAHVYLRKARYCYLRWGAAGKVRQLDELYPQLGEEPVTGPTSTIGTPVEHLDLATVIKVSQAVSGEIVLEKLIDTLMRTAIEHAGAERGLLVLQRGVEQWIAAEATTSGDSVIVRLQEAPVAEAAVPESIVHYVVRTQESVILGDASARNPFSADTYIREHHARSILCLPLINQGKFIGLLYLENNLTPHVFTSTRISVLKLLAAQAAMSLENTRLYRDLEEREAKIRRLVDANIIGIGVWNLEGEIIEANEALLQMLQYSREDLVSGHMRWTDLTPPEWRERTERAISEVKATGTLQPYEKEFFRKDGSRVPVLIGSAMFEGSKNEGVAFVLDLTEQKRAEEALRRSEANLAEAQRLSQTGSFGWDVSSGKIYWSQETFRIFGYDPAIEPTLEIILRRTHPEDRVLVRQVIDRVLNERKDFDMEHRLLMPDKSVKYLRVVGHRSTEDESGNFEFVGVVTDITERKQAEEALQKAQAELAHVTRVTTLGELTTSIAHEINQPLGAVVNNASACLRWLAARNLEEARQSASLVIADGHRAGEIIGRIRALAKKAPPHKDWLDLNKAIGEVIAIAESAVQQNRVLLQSQLASDLPPIWGDRVQLQQVILNLLINAVEAMSAVNEGQRELWVSSQRVTDLAIGSEEDMLEDKKLAGAECPLALITVRDSGPGLDPAGLDRLFDAFYTTKPEGLGMGLAISRSIIEAHGGRLWATANAPQGAVFQFALPISHG